MWSMFVCAGCCEPRHVPRATQRHLLQSVNTCKACIGRWLSIASQSQVECVVGLRFKAASFREIKEGWRKQGGRKSYRIRRAVQRRSTRLGELGKEHDPASRRYTRYLYWKMRSRLISCPKNQRRYTEQQTHRNHDQTYELDQVPTNVAICFHSEGRLGASSRLRNH
jgi:hypothetical protein